jgi:hypothetical protein
LSFGKYKLVATNEILADGEFQAIAEVAQDATTEGFVDLSPEDTVDIVVANAKGTAPIDSDIPAYDNIKIKDIQQQSSDIRKVIKTIGEIGITGLKLLLEEKMKKSLSIDLQYIQRHINSITIQEGVLCMGGNANQPKNPRWFLQEEAMYDYMKLLHRDVNHFGGPKLLAMASKTVLRPRMYLTATAVVSRCATCLQCVDAIQKNSPPTGTTRAKIPWESLSVDVMHVLPSNGFQYILMCSDNASSYVWAFPLCTQDARSIIDKIDKEIFQVYGAYEEIAYDGAQQLCGVEMACFLKM